VQAGQQVELTVGLAQVVDLRLEVPLGDLVLEVGHQVQVVAHREDRPGGHEGVLLRVVRLRNDQRGVTGADQQTALLLVVAQRHRDRVDLHVRPLGELRPEQPVLLQRVEGVVVVERGEGERFGGLELVADAVGGHRADPVLGEVRRLRGVVGTGGGDGEREQTRGG
jgi:hypothetical protein